MTGAAISTARSGRRTCWVLVAVALAGHAAVLVVWPAAHALLIDLQVYRTGGERVLDGDSLYAGVHPPFVYPPFAAVLFAPLALLPLPVLKVLWTGVNVALLGYIVHRCARSLGVPSGPGLTTGTAGLVALATWLDPVRTTLYLGQINIVLLALVVGDVLGRRESRWRGVGVGIAAAIKLTPLVIVPYLALTGRRRAAGVATAVFAGALALGVLAAPTESVVYWWRGTFAAADRISAVTATTNHSLSGFVARSLGGDGPAATVTYLLGGAAVAAVALALAVRAHHRGDEVLALALCGLTSAAVAPFAWSHHWVWCVPVVVTLAVRAAAGGRTAGVLLLGVLAVTLAVVTALPSATVGPLPRTGLVSLQPDVYLLGYAFGLVAVAWWLRLHPNERHSRPVRLDESAVRVSR